MTEKRFLRFARAVCLLIPMLQACGAGEISSGGDSTSDRPISDSRVSISPSAGETPAGETITRSVKILAEKPIFFTAFDVIYDPDIIEFTGAVEGNFLSRSGTETTSFLAALENGLPGRVTVGLTRLGPVKGVSGEGNLVTLNFRALKPGTSGLSFSAPLGLRGFDETESLGQAWENGIVTVRQ